MRLTFARPPAAASIRRKRRGFTLIELMVTLAVFAILCLLAMPSFNTWIANNRVRAVAEDVSNGLLLARTEALRRSRQSVFALTNQANPAGAVNAGAPAYSAVSGSANNWAVSIAPSLIDSNAGVFVRGGALADINASVTINGPAAACFDPLGNLITNASAVANTGVGASCSAPSGGQPALIYSVKSASAAGDHPLQIEVGLGGQVRLCNPAQSLSSGTPGASEGCQYPQGATP